jgi:hypothetical protein
MGAPRSPLHYLPHAALFRPARQGFFLLVQLTPERSPTAFHSADLAETFISSDKALSTKGFGFIHCSCCSLAISLHKPQRVIKWQRRFTCRLAGL